MNYSDDIENVYFTDNYSFGTEWTEYFGNVLFERIFQKIASIEKPRVKTEEIIGRIVWRRNQQ